METQEVARPKTLVACKAAEPESLRTCRKDDLPDGSVLEDQDERSSGRHSGEGCRWPAVVSDGLRFSRQREGGNRENLRRIGHGGQRSRGCVPAGWVADANSVSLEDRPLRWAGARKGERGDHEHKRSHAPHTGGGSLWVLSAGFHVEPVPGQRLNQ